MELKSELKDELSKELVTKTEFAEFKAEMRGEFKAVREEMKTMRVELDRKFTIMFLVLFFTTLFVNKDTISFFLRVIGVLK